MTQTELSTTNKTIEVSPERHEVIFHDASQCTEYVVEKSACLELFDITIGATSAYHKNNHPSHYRGGEGGVSALANIEVPSSLPLPGGGRSVSNSRVKIVLNGVGAEVWVYALFFGTDEELFEISHEVIHRAPRTTSRILTRGALGGGAKASYNGNIRISKGIPGCDGLEEAHTLLLSRDAHIDAAPHLEIGNNDVACAHSVSVSYIDEVKRFYCESRGLSEEEAVKAIVVGHFSAVLDKIQNEEFRMQVERSISVKLNRN